MAPVVTWPIPLTEKEFDRYALAVNGTPVPVWTGRVREEIHKPRGAGWTHMFNGKTEWCGFARFDFPETAEVVVTVAGGLKTAQILPRSARIEPVVDGQTVRFTMTEPRHLTLLVNESDEEVLHLFTLRPETEKPDPKDPNVLYFGPGEHWVDHVNLASGQTVYLDGGAILRASLPAGAVGKQGGVLNLFSYGNPVFNIEKVENVRVMGRGILDGTLLPHPAKNLIRVSGSKGVRIEGILLRNSPNWNLPIVNSSDVTVDGLVCLGGRLNSDGINCVGSDHVAVRNCFVRNHDDSYAVKTTHPARGSHDILYEDCVAWNDWGFAFGVTYETRADIRNITWRRCDSIFCRNWPIGIHATDSGAIADILFEDMTVDYPPTRIAPAMSRQLIRIDNKKDVWSTEPGVGSVSGVTIRNVDVRGVDVGPVTIMGADAGHPVTKVLLENVVINGKPLERSAIQTNEHVGEIVVRP